MTNIETTQGINDPGNNSTSQAWSKSEAGIQRAGGSYQVSHGSARPHAAGSDTDDREPIKSLGSTFWDSDSYDAHGSCTPQTSGRTS